MSYSVAAGHVTPAIAINSQKLVRLTNHSPLTRIARASLRWM